MLPFGNIKVVLSETKEYNLIYLIQNTVNINPQPELLANA